MAAEFNMEEEDNLAYEMKEFYKELEKLSTTPPEPNCRLLKLYNLIGQNDEIFQVLVTNAFANSKWKKISVYVTETQSSFEGDRTMLFNAIFRGSGRNTVIEVLELSAHVTDEEEEQLPVSVPFLLPPNLRKLDLWYFDIREDVESNRKGLPESIQKHKNLKSLFLHGCSFCPTSLGMSIDCNESLQYLQLNGCRGDLKEFFDSVINGAIRTLLLWNCRDDLGISGIQAMERAVKQNRMVFEKLELFDCIDENDVDALTTMLPNATTITELYLWWKALEAAGDDELQRILWSLQDKEGLQVLEFHYLSSGLSSKSAELIKDFCQVEA